MQNDKKVRQVCKVRTMFYSKTQNLIDILYYLICFIAVLPDFKCKTFKIGGRHECMFILTALKVCYRCFKIPYKCCRQMAAWNVVTRSVVITVFFPSDHHNGTLGRVIFFWVCITAHI